MTDDETPPAAAPQDIQFHYIKSNQFRVVHGDGVIGGITPRGLIHFSVYSERAAIPQIIVTEFDGLKAGKEIQRIGRDGIVRELETDLILDLEAAESLRDWLDDKIGALKKARSDIEAKKKAREK